MGNDSNEEKLSEEMIDETLAESFPASDPPSWMLGRERRKPEKGADHARSVEADKGKPRTWRARFAVVCKIAAGFGVILLVRSRLCRGNDRRGSLPSRIRRFTQLR